MEIEGKLKITFDPELNSAGQLPVSISFEGKGGLALDVMGVRYKNGHVLDSVAISNRGWAIYHTKFSPELQSVIIDLATGKVKEAPKVNQEYQDKMNEKMSEMAKRAGYGPKS